MSADTCTDCGTAPVHVAMGRGLPAYCRRCAEKAGHGYALRIEVDVDKVLSGWEDSDES